MPKYNDKKREKALTEIKKGTSQLKVAKQLGIPRSTIWGWMNKEGLVKSKKAKSVPNAKKTTTKKPKKSTKSTKKKSK